jgi:pyridoxine 4-dehydrogenase
VDGCTPNRYPIRAGGDVNRRIRQALAPYREALVIVSKVGAAHTSTGAVPLTAAQKPAELRATVEDDLVQLGVETIPVVNLRRLDLGPGLRAEGDQIVSLDDIGSLSGEGLPREGVEVFLTRPDDC